MRPSNKCSIISITLICMFLLVIQVVAQNPDTTLSAIKWSPSGDKIAVGYTNGSIQIISTQTNQTLVTLQGHTARVSTIAWSPDGTQLASGALNPDNAIIIWNAVTGQIISQHFEVGIDVLTVTWNPNGNQIWGIPAEGLSQIWDAASGNLLTTQQLGTVSDAKWHPNNNLMAVATAAGIISVYDSTTFQRNLQLIAPANPNGGNQLTTIAWNNDGSLIASGNFEGQVRVWSVNTQTLLLDLQSNNYLGDDYLFRLTVNVFFSIDGSKITSISGDGTANTWDASTGQLLHSITLPSPIYASAIHPNGTTLVYGGATSNVQFAEIAWIEILSLLDSTYLPVTGRDPLLEGANIDLGTLSALSLIFRANPNPATVGSVKFSLNGVEQIDDTLPYEFTNWTPSIGVYTLSATPYSGAGATGTAGTALTINFSVSIQESKSRLV